MQQELQRIQQEISSYRDECKALDNDERLHDTVSVKQSLESETAALRQTLRSLYQAAVADEEGLMAFRERVMVLLRSTETAIRLYQRSRLWREVSTASGAPNQAALLASQAVQEQISAPVQLPNPFLGLAVRGFNDALEQYHKCISELERVLPASGAGVGGGADEAAAVSGLPTLVSHMHDYFVHVAARLERLHGEVGRAREAYLAQRRARGDYSDPFADARPLHHMSAGPTASKPGGLGLGGAGGAPAGAGFYSFGGPAASGAGPGASGAGGAGGGSSAFGGAASSVPASPAPAGASAGGAPASGGLFGMTPGPLGAATSPFGAPAAGGAASPAPFGTPLMGFAAMQPQQPQRVNSSRAGSSSSKKR
ncbi:hypothetical protein GPECTOR_39g391 [Gonium pectorale]|uniref:Uncharacterized protein n=1 Tax=Gonium pectorale TaxID=33097 RepID=A0A150GAM5_GONPE|nr:hypothetical protein GPECTOR_39g391 [Gonium pectorale]|eukprot:KXZ46897.1 hypothetical protein GPECTOR_39g391 [Gonium pectorale]